MSWVGQVFNLEARFQQFLTGFLRARSYCVSDKRMIDCSTMLRILCTVGLVSMGIAVFPGVGSAQSLYNVSIDTSRVRGSPGRLVFDITSNQPLTNRTDLLRFTTDGLTDLPQTLGGLVTGDVIQGLSPAPFTRMTASTFLTELTIPFIAFGDSVSFGVNVSETPPRAQTPPDEFSFYLLDSAGSSLAGERGKPDFSVTITGQRGGTLTLGSGAVVSRGRTPEAAEPGGRSQAAVTVTQAWTIDDPALTKLAQPFEGTLTEYCNRRCAAETSCTGGAFGVAVDSDTFYAFDDIGNLKAQVALVESGVNPQTEGQFGHAKVVGVLNSNSVLTVLSVQVF
jgi:hypothetical protein